MSYTSQPTNNRSMNGIITFDDGNGGILENGILNADHSDTTTAEVDNITIDSQLNLIGNLYVNATTITPTVLSYLFGATSNIQNQISSLISNLLSTANTWTAIQTFGNGSLTQYLNTNTVYPTRSSSAVGGIMGHSTDTKSLHVVNANSNLTSYENAFMFDKLDSSSSMVNLMRITNGGNLYLPYTLGSDSLSTVLSSKQAELSAINKLNAGYIGTTGLVSNTEYDYLANVTSDIQTQINAKQNTIDASNRLDASYIGANGNVSNVEYGYLSSVTSDIQTQIDSKGSLAGTNTWTNPQTFSQYATFDTSIDVATSILAQSISISSLVVSDVSTLKRQYITYVSISASTTYTSTDLPSYIGCNNASFTVTLPTAASIGDGFICTIMNVSTVYTVDVDSTSNFRYNTATWPSTGGSVVNSSTALTIDSCQIIRLLSYGSIWMVI